MISRWQSSKRKILVPLLAAAFATAVTVVSAPAAPAAPAAANRGPAIIRIDIPSAQVIELRSGATTLNRLIVAPTTRVQWLGERADSSGVLLTRSEYTSSRTLVKTWASFGHTRQIGATLTWGKGDRLQVAPVTLHAPTATAKGQVALTFTTTRNLPKRLKNATLNLERASVTARSFPYTPRATYLSSTLYAQVTAHDAYTTMNYFYCGATMVASYDLYQDAPVGPMQSPLGGCDPIIENGMLEMQIPTQTQSGFVFLQATLQPSYGEPMQYAASIGSWSLSGS